MRVLLDTCALVWFAVNDKPLSAKARIVLESFETEGLVGAASAWEIATKARLGKWPGAEELAADLPAMIREPGFTELPIAVHHAQRAGMLPGGHKDPFDRIFDEYHIRRIW